MRSRASQTRENGTPSSIYRWIRQQRFSVDSMVRVIDREHLEIFLREGKGHPPIEDRQLEYAGRLVKIRGVGFYHEEGQIYYLEGLPGFWDEECLEPDRPGASAEKKEESKR